MSKSFDVLKQPWIPVQDLEGNRSELGVLELLQKAPTLHAISSDSPLIEFALYRLLIVFLMDALHPEDDGALSQLLQDGAFNHAEIEKYIDLCTADGVSFDLFDEKRPFLQSSRDSTLDGDPKPVSILNCTVPSGNNHFHFDHRTKSELFVSYSEAARLLPAALLFCTAGAQGYPSGPYGAPPYFSLILGDNLFQTLVLNLIPEEDFGRYDVPPALWRSPDLVIPKQAVEKTSCLYGMLFPTRRIRLIPDGGSGTVRSVFYCQGMNYTSMDTWIDPAATYVSSEKGRHVLRPNRDKAVWRNLRELIDHENGSMVVRQYFRLEPDCKEIHLNLYGVQTSNASYLDVMRHDLRVPAAVASDNDKLDTLKSAIAAAESAAYGLKSALSSGKLPNQGVTCAVQSFYDRCEPLLWTLCENGLMVDNRSLRDSYQSWCEEVSQLALETWSNAVEQYRFRSRELAEIVNWKWLLTSRLRKNLEVIQ